MMLTFSAIFFDFEAVLATERMISDNFFSEKFRETISSFFTAENGSSLFSYPI